MTRPRRMTRPRGMTCPRRMARSRKKMNKFKNATGVDTMLSSHKKNAQPEMNHVTSAKKSDILPKCAGASKRVST